MIALREVTVSTPPSRPPRTWNGEGEVLGVVPLCAQCSEEEAQVGLVAPEDVGPAEAETVIRPRTPDEPLVVDVARGLDGGGVIEQAHHIRMHVSYRVGDYREEGDVLGSVWLCVLAVLGVGFVLEELAPEGDATLGVRMRPSDVDDEVGVADDAGEVAAGRELDVDVALFPLGARRPAVDGRVRGDRMLVGGGGDAREVAQYAVKLVLKLIMQSYEMASAPAGARRAMVAVGVKVLAAALYVTMFLLHVIRVSGGEAKGRCHQCAPAPLAALALVVKEV